jgi:hypothetical protein
MKLYSRIKLKKEIAGLRRAGVEEIPCAELAAKLSKRHRVPVSRSYVKWYCDSRGIPTVPKIVAPRNPCIYCGGPVIVRRGGGPYKQHRDCERRANAIWVTCSRPACDVTFTRSPCFINEGNNYCSKPCYHKHRRALRIMERETQVPV